MSHCLKTLLVVACAVLLVGSAACRVWGGKNDDADAGGTPALRPRALRGVTVPLECGLLASETAGVTFSKGSEHEQKHDTR